MSRTAWLLAAVLATACQRPAPKQEHSGPSTASSGVSTAPSASAAPLEPEPSSDEDFNALCRRFEATQIPAADQPRGEQATSLKGCDAQALFYGIATPVDYERARHCAFVSKDAAILMMTYANGRGVPANFELALRFTCELEGAPLELYARLLRLWRARQKGRLEEPLDVCDDVTSGYMSGYCAAQRERIAAVPRKARLAAVTKSMPLREWHALEAAANRYIDARTRYEVDLSGTLRAAFAIDEQTKLEESFVLALEKVADPSFEPSSATEVASEAALAKTISNLASCKMLREVNPDLPGLVTLTGIRTTQRQWLNFRSAFLTLSRKLHPDGRVDDWRAWLTAPRIGQLLEWRC